MLQEMYNQWPFFRVTIDLVEMVFAKGNPDIAALYDSLLVSEELRPLGERLRANYEETQKLLLQVCLLNLHTFHALYAATIPSYYHKYCLQITVL